MTLCRHVRAVAWKQDHSASSVLICSTSRVWRPSPYNRIPADLTGVEPIITVFLYLIWRRFDMMTKRLQTNLHLWLGLARWQVIFFSTGIMIIKHAVTKEDGRHFEEPLRSYLCEAVDHPANGCCVKEHHGNSQNVSEQPWMQDTRCIDRSIGQEQSAEEHKEACHKKETVYKT